MFGHEKGSFTGAVSRHAGKFEQAHGGTLFLDEVGDMPAIMQAKLLRVLEQRQVERIGGNQTIDVDVRVVVATHRDLPDLVQKRVFREDLFHRIYVFPLSLPPLRDRRDDIPLLIEHFARLIATQNDWAPRAINAEALALLQSYHWPGNVRELRNVVERLLLLADGDVDVSTVRLALPALGERVATLEVGSGTLAERVNAFERAVIEAELRRHENRMTETARALGLERSHLYKKCQQHGIERKSVE
jgi:two-component system, NtrC family, nitrogen regulation response regulator NtrX